MKNICRPIQWLTWFSKICALLLAVFWVAPMSTAATIELHIHDSAATPLENVVVALKPKAPTQLTPLPRALMDQRDYQFVPKVLAIPTNTQVFFPNSDDVRHHVYSFSPAKKFELRLYHGKTAEPILFDHPGKVVLGCNIHDSMVGYIYVVDTPYFALSDAKGNVRLTDLPSGAYELQIFYYRQTQVPETEVVQLTDVAVLQKNIELENVSDPEASSNSNEFDDLFN